MKKIILLTTAITLLSGCGGVTYTNDSVDAPTSVVVSSKITPVFEVDLEAKMQALKLPGFSLTVFEDYKVVYSNQWGVKAAGSPDLIDGQTAFSTASMAKPITALLCVILEERGLINLDDPISEYITSWSLPDSEHTRDTPVTWKHLLSHMAGTTQSGFADFYEGDSVPSLVDSLQGKLPRYDVPISFTFKPGTDWKYSGGGYTIVQMALQDHFGKPLHTIVAENIFVPLGMDQTTMIQPNEAGFLSNTARVHNSDGDVIRSGLPITPQVSASGMWSTPQDLAKLSIDLQKALRGDKDSVISQKTAKTVTDIISLKGSGGNALGWLRAFGFGNIDWIRHDGSNTGVGGDMLISPDGGNGFVFFANGEKPNRFPVDSYVRSEVIRMMKWETPVTGGKRAPDALIKSIQGPYKDFLYQVGMDSQIVSSDDKIYLVSPVFEHFLGKDRSEMFYLGENTFKIMDYPNLVRFNLDAQNQVKNLTMLRHQDDSLTYDVGIER
jgi:CubicO group peptidase (beta-lactamase class C family)